MIEYLVILFSRQGLRNMKLGRNMYKFLKLASVLILLASNAAAEDSFFLDDNITVDYIKNLEVRVELLDGATGACWTNLREVREYAEEKLRTFGVKVSQTEYSNPEANIYWLNIHVYAHRLYDDGTGPCFGGFRFQLVAAHTINGQVHAATLGSLGTNASISPSDNFNRQVLVGLEQVFATFPK